MANFSGPNIAVPLVMPDTVPKALAPIIQPIYLAFYNIVQTLVLHCGIGPRSSDKVLLSNGDPTAILANNVHRFYIQASENINSGAMVNLFAPLPGVLGVRNANATNYTKPCHGFCSQPGGIAAGAIGEIIVSDGVDSNLSGLTVGSEYYLDTVNGQITAVPPVAAGNLEQSLGIAISATTLRFWTGHKIFH